jgi:hypothetical protein
MAQKRMFTIKIVDSDAFLDMPLSTQCLYFHLNMRADDDGFVGNPKKIMRMIGASEDDFKILIAKKFILIFENNVVVIKHWWMHNTLSKDRYHETSYTDEKSLLKIKDNKSYTLEGDGIPLKTVETENVNKMLTECSQDVNSDLGLNLDIDKDLNLNKDKTGTKKEPKVKFGEYKNVLLSLSEYNRFVEEYGEDKTIAFIQHFSELKELKGYSYDSDNLALRRWGIYSYEESAKKNDNHHQRNLNPNLNNPANQL